MKEIDNNLLNGKSIELRGVENEQEAGMAFSTLRCNSLREIFLNSPANSSENPGGAKNFLLSDSRIN